MVKWDRSLNLCSLGLPFGYHIGPQALLWNASSPGKQFKNRDSRARDVTQVADHLPSMRP
jgi:hypothetical protein